MTSKRQPLSVAIVTQNEASNVVACLDSVVWADEIVVVDSGSEDETREICRSRGALVVEAPWEGYSAQKNLALERTRYPWILSLDADERVGDALRGQIERVLAADGPADGYRVPRRNFFFGKWLRHGDHWPDHQIRLFRRERGQFNGKSVHESVVMEGETGELSEPLDHFSYRTLHEFFDRQVRYAALAAEDMAGKGAVPRASDFFLRPIGRFLKGYVLKAGWRDGREGFIAAAGSAFYVFMRAAFLWENRRKGESA
ncbi:MAG: glycosyltransferase family 2 protein [bacterium]|nr:glycosyltransferase family 2 protein [bacterium]